MRVFYFSGTGNSKSVAKKLFDGAEDIAKIKDRQFEDNSNGIVFPVYCSGVPKMVERFIKESQFNCDYIWAVATCGGSQGGSLTEVNEYLKKKGKRLSYAAEIVMPDSCIIFATSPEKMAILLKEETAKVEAIKEDITAKLANKIKKAPFYKIIKSVMWAGFVHWFGLNKKKAEGCIGCGICERNCMTGNITVKDNNVAFGNNCEYCFSCIQRCPKGAISFGKIKPTDSTRYYHKEN
jgi:ferredoxin